MEFLFLDKWNAELVNNTLKVVHAAFINYERVHTIYLESLDDTADSEGDFRIQKLPKGKV